MNYHGTVKATYRGSPGSLRETLFVTVAGTFIVAILCWPAMNAYFLAENFQYLGQYFSHQGSFWRALLSPTDGIFFRPAFFAVQLPWFFLFPDDPVWYHVRNLVFTGLDILILHRLSLRLIETRTARIFAIALFAISKGHLTTIGYINIFDSIIMLMFLLLAMLFFARALESPGPWNYAAALLFSTLSVFSKDFGLAACVVVAIFVGERLVTSGEWSVRRWARLLAPLPVIVAGYLVVRFQVVRALPSQGSVYAPTFSVDLWIRKLALWTSTLANVSFASKGTSGEYGIAGTAIELMRGGRVLAICGEAVVLIVVLGLVAATLWKARIHPAAILLTGGWIAAYLAPTLLTRNMQMYYGYESIAGCALLLGIATDKLSHPRWKLLWTAALLLVAANGMVSNSRPSYYWADATEQARAAVRKVVPELRARGAREVWIVSSRPDFWSFTLGTSESTPMLSRLLGRPDLKVMYATAGAFSQERSTPFGVAFDADHDFAVLAPSRP